MILFSASHAPLALPVASRIGQQPPLLLRQQERRANQTPYTMHASVNVILVVVCFVFGNRPATGVPVARNESTTIDSISDTEAAWEETTTTTPTSSPSPTSVESADKEVARKKGHDKRVITLSAAHEEPVTNEVSEKAFEDLEFLCHHFYKDEFVVSAHVTEAGCQLECVLLKSSGAHGSSFFDTSVRKQHNINEGQTCDSENVSLPFASCLQSQSRGSHDARVFGE